MNKKKFLENISDKEVKETIENHKYSNIFKQAVKMNDLSFKSIKDVAFNFTVEDFKENLDLYGKIKVRENLQSMIVKLSKSIIEKIQNTRISVDTYDQDLKKFIETLNNIAKSAEKAYNSIELLAPSWTTSSGSDNYYKSKEIGIFQSPNFDFDVSYIFY